MVAALDVWAALASGVDMLELADVISPPRWHRDALCLEYPDVEWFPLRGESVEPAREVCRRCAVRAECLEYALPLVDLHGVWGGSSRMQRKQARKHGLDVDEVLAAVDTRTRSWA